MLILLALLLVFYNRYADASAGQEAELLLEDILSVLAANPSEGATTGEALSADMPVVKINGYEYVGYLSIPALELELPVMAEWDYTRLKIAPCRQFGSSGTDDLVIAAHNYNSHFGRLSNLEVGADVLFTDMDGIENQYIVQGMSTLSPDAVDAVQNSGYDLVLYTCTPSGKTRVVVFCDRAEKETSGH